ncbi:MAG TPA: IS21 family transposase [Patescibacteria group bacterium]|nr:IS21 family transposase [Patescibacteria group bacterium]
MLEHGEIFMIHELHREGLSIRAIARRTGFNRRTVTKYLRRGLDSPAYGPRSPRGSVLDDFKGYIKERLEEFSELTAVRLLREIREMGYRGGYTTVKDYVRDVRPVEDTGYEHRFETPAGKQGQVDFAHFAVRFTDTPSEEHRLWLFSMVLGCSRHLAGRFVWRQDLATVVRCHMAAFEKIGGVPREILYDQMKTAVIGEEDPRGIIYNKTLLALSQHYGFIPRACPKHRAKTKGKIERPYRYIRQDFFMGRRFRNYEDLNRQFDQWLDEVANRRLHGTTRRLVHEAFAEEKKALLPLPAVPFGSVLKLERRITRDGMVSVDGNLYSVPDTTKRRVVEVQVTATEVSILEEGQLVAVHPVLEGSGKRRVAEGHRRYPPPGNAKVRRERVAEEPIGLPGERVATRSLEVYAAVASALARDGRGMR